MKLRSVLGLFLLSIFTLVVAGCGSDDVVGGGGGAGTAGTGTAAAGLVSGGTVQVFQIFSTHNPAKARISGTAITGATATSGADGSFNISLPKGITNGGVLVQMTGGTYKDEATGATLTLAAQAGATGLRAVFSNISGAVRRGSLKVNVTPFTELGVQSLVLPATDVNIAAANNRVKTTFATLLKTANIFTSKPYDVTVAPPAGATTADTDYSLALATISQLQVGPPALPTLTAFFAAFLPDVNAGALQGAHVTAVPVANLNFINSANNKTGTVAPAVTVAVTPATATTASTTGAGIPITATVQQGGVNVPDGTQVTFTRTAGTGGTLSATSALTVGGVATVTLTSAVTTSGIVITAKAGGVTGSTAALAFANPNDPGTILLTANPTIGGTNGASPVTLTATVTPADPVNGVIANGTVVTFSILSGTGGTITAVTTTTPGTVTGTGVATAILNSTVANTISVNARAGTATSNTVPVQFVVQPTLATVKVATTGTLPVGTRIGGVNFIVTQTATGLTIADGDVTATGTSVGSLIVPNTTVPASVSVALISTAGFTPTGEIATLVYHIPAGTFPTPANFSVALTGAGVIDTNGVAIPNIGVTISIPPGSVTIQ